MGLFDELKQRLKQAEVEQKRQHDDLGKLRNFAKEVKEFEAKLKLISSQFEMQTQQQDYSNLRNLDETRRLEAELKRMDEQYQAVDARELRYLEEIAQLRFELMGEPVPASISVGSQNARAGKSPSSKPATSQNTVSHFPINEDKSNKFTEKLAQANDYKAQDLFEERYFEEIEQLRTKLVSDDMTMVLPPQPKANLAKKTASALPPPEKKKNNHPVKVQNKPNFGYVICLTLNTQAPAEWSEESGGGWHEPGKGMCYTDAEQVKQNLRKIKKQWPDYPLKVIKRQLTV